MTTYFKKFSNNNNKNSNNKCFKINTIIILCMYVLYICIVKNKFIQDTSNRSKNESNGSNNSLNPLGRFRKATSKISQNEIFCKNGNKHQQQQSQQPSVADRSVTTTSLVGHKNGFFPGQKIQTVTTQEKSDRGCGGGMFSGNKTTVTTTSRPSGGFNPILGGKTTTSTTTHRGVFGNATSVETHTQQSGGFTIIPFGVIGLAAVGAIAAKNAYDSHEDRRMMEASSSPTK